MATIVIKDLSDSTELDREAMQAIVGGTRNGGRPWRPEAGAGTARIVDYPPGMARVKAVPTKRDPKA